MKVAIAGANGNVGGRLGEILANRREELTGFIRKEAQSGALEYLGLKTQIADIVSIETDDYASMLEGMEQLIKAAESAGVDRFLLVSAFPDAWKDKGMPDSFESYMKMKCQAVVSLANSSLNWTILRPGTLTDEKGEENVTLCPAIPYGMLQEIMWPRSS